MNSTNRRSTELGLVLLAAAITGAAYTLVALGKTSTLPGNIGVFLGVVVVLLVGAHLATRLLAPGADGVLLPLACLLNGVGYVFIARINPRLAGLQATWTLVGIVAYVATLYLVRKPGELARYKWTFFFTGFLLLMMPFLPKIGRNINGSRIWVRLGPLGFQPGEIAKITLALFFAAYLTERRELLAMAGWRVGPFNLPEPRHLAPLLMAWGISVVIMVGQKDLGSSLLFFVLFAIMVWVATERGSYLAISVVLFAGGAYLSWRKFAHVKTRVAIWLNPWADAQHSGYQIIQALFAFGAGGTVGTGLGLGAPDRIPEAKNDFIFAAIGEELGLLGTTAILVTFLLMIGAGLRIAMRAERPFEKLLATGLTTIIGVQAFIIIGGVTRVVPLTGVTLPFVSYGGSSLVANYVLLALMMRLSDTTAQRLGEVPPKRRKRRANEADVDATTAIAVSP